MSDNLTETDPAADSADFYAQIYDTCVPDWPGEIDFYRALAAEATDHGLAALEVGCGTGRVTLRLAQDGADVVGLDLSPQMLAVARSKSAGQPNVRWVEADMRAFDLGQRFGLLIVPGHSFQFCTTPSEQVACLECFHRHLEPDGRLVVHLDHQDIGWLGSLARGTGGAPTPAEEFVHPRTGRTIRALRAWTYEPSTQTATAHTVWEERGADGRGTARWERGPSRLHCIFRFEMEHLLARSGFRVEALYGDFLGSPLADTSSDMVWLARPEQASGI